MRELYKQETGDISDCLTYLNDQGEFVISERFYEWLEKKANGDYAVLCAVGDEDAKEPIQNALYSTGKFTTDQCSDLADGILQFIKDAGYKVANCT